MVMDNLDNKAIYYGTTDRGIYYTYNGGAGWQQTLSGRGKINDIAISPKESCIIYVAIGNRVYKTSDCSRNWEYKLIEASPNTSNIINTLAVDPYNSSVVYSGTSGKGLYRSDDSGYSWHVVKYFDGPIVKVMLNPNFENMIYVATSRNGIFKSIDGGENWQEVIGKELPKQYTGMLEYHKLIFDNNYDDGLFFANKYGLFRSFDGGENWNNIELLIKPGVRAIYSIAVNPTNEDEIYYTVSDTFYRSEDGGENWVTRNLPTSRAPKFMLLDPLNPDTLYIGTKRVK
jgi:photosystem II stability/assembly factor-like uncharacterized protein